MRKQNKKVIYVFLLALNFANVFVVSSSNLYHERRNSGSDPISAAPYTLNIGAWIIVAGDRESDHDLYYCIEQGCNEVYDQLISMGFPATRIRYLAGNWDGSLPSNADAESTRVNLEDAITNWAVDKVDSNNALGIFLFDHGGYGVMGLPGPNLGDTHLNSYLDTLESSSGMDRSVIIYEACHSGSFINPVSKTGRIIITATDTVHGSYPNPELTHAVFSEHFWAAVTMGYKLGYCFEYATWCVDLWGLSDIQKPWIDDNYDEIGHGVDSGGDLPYGGDGYDANDISLGDPVYSLNLVTFLKCPLTRYVISDTNDIPLWVVAENTSKIDYIKARVFPSWWEWPEPEVDDEGISYFPENAFNGFYSFNLLLDPESSEQGEQNFTTSINPGRYPNIFGRGEGEYRILYEAKAEDGIVATPLTSKIILNGDGDAPVDMVPPTILITNPETEMKLSNGLNITAKGDDDQALEQIRILVDGKLMDTIYMPKTYPYPEATYELDTTKYTNGYHNITALALDESGNTAQSSVIVEFQNSSIQSIEYQPYLIGAGIGIVVSIGGSLIIRKKKK